MTPLEMILETWPDEEFLKADEFNIGGAYVGEKTPIYVDDLFFDDFKQS